MNDVTGMKEFGGPEELVKDVLFVNFFEDITPFDDIMEVRV